MKKNNTIKFYFLKNKTVHCIDCGREMDAGLSFYTFEGKPICLDCEKNDTGNMLNLCHQ